MRHKHKGRKLGTDHGHTKAMKVSLVQALFLNDRIKTTETRAKEIRGDVDRIITWAKKGDLHSRRLAIAALGNDSDLVREIFDKVNQGMFEGRPGGYTRIMKLGPRKGDGARMVIMELINETCVPKAERKAATSGKATAKKAAAKRKPAKKADDKQAVKDAEAEVKAEEKENDANRENVLERIHDTFEAFEEESAEQIREDGEEQLAEEEAEAKREDGETATEDGAPAKEDLREAAKEALEKKEAADEAAAGDPTEDVAKDETAEEVRKEQFEDESAAAKEAESEDNAPNPADMPESEEHAR